MTNQTKSLAKQLHQAYLNHQPIPFLNPDAAVDETLGYAVQQELTQRIQSATGSTVAGYKVSMTSKATQAYANTHEPAYGTLLSHVVKASNTTLNLPDLFSPLIEPELVFEFTEDVSNHPTVEEVLSKSKIAPAIEVPDARYIDWFPHFTLGDLLADNTATGLVVVGETVDTPDYDTLGDISMTLQHNKTALAEGHSSAVLGHPVKAIQWLAEKLAAHGKSLKAGDIVSSGTFITPLQAEVGTYHVEYTHIGSVNVTFE
ncbi:fumarylacetoacetate hydrolase family protein [Staphylococcus agnetis]|uniref:Fumarylacetoacetate hydrolase family protein n=1 Tax=Staphylococcus agnetis TaxID=985762 RepID=A0ABD7TTY4_9STAP|nr:fumarylacetoacetate hydrolase family protein [Staphylococcus agnetis]UXU57204.1 fumarylacetoacetate hydrolase family protein [Staphylococcus agnetis]